MKPILPCLISLLLIASVADAQTLYRWVDKDGKVTYSDKPPPKEIRKAEEKRLSTPTIETSTLPYDLQKALQDFPVTVYTTPDCAEECRMARDYLAKRGVPYTEKSLVSNDEIAALKGELKTANLFVPAIFVGTQKRQGFEENAWNSLLDAAGYPRSAIPGAATKTPPAPAGR